MSALAAPWVKETSATTGTGVLILTGKVEKYIRFNMGLSAGAEVWYSIEDANGNREAGIGVFNGTNQLTRQTVHSTLVSGVFNDINPTPINLSGNSVVTCTFNANAYNELVTNISTTQSVISTGILYGGTLSINAVDSSKFDISAGKGVILDASTPNNPLVKTVEWGDTEGVTVTNIATSDSSLIAINSLGAIVQSTSSFSSAQSRSLILLGGLSHSNNTNLETSYSLKMPSYNIGASLKDLASALGLINQSGNNFSANGANLLINRNGGVVFAYGQNFDVNPNNPHHVTTSDSTGETFLRVHGDGSGNLVVESVTDTVNPNSYDVSGTLTTVPNNRWTNIRLYVYPNSGTNVVRYGSAHYASKADALNALLTESVTEIKELSTAILRGWLTVEKGATQLSNQTQAVFTGNNGNVGGGSGTPSTGLMALVDDPNPQLGGNLDTNSYTISFTSTAGLTATDLAAAIDEAYTASIKSSDLGQPDGVATLDSGGKVPAAQLPSYVDDVVEVATYSALPVTGESGKIYIVIADETSGGNTTQYRWSGSAYILISNNMSASDIKTLYESNSDTNAFTDAEKTKLTNIGSATELVEGLIRKHTQAEAQAGTDNTGSMSALRVHQAFGYYGLGLSSGVRSSTGNDVFAITESGFNAVDTNVGLLNAPTNESGSTILTSVYNASNQFTFFMSRTGQLYSNRKNFGTWETEWREYFTSYNLVNAQNLSGATVAPNGTVAGSSLSPAKNGTWRNVCGVDVLNNGYGLFRRV